ncbi:MAG: tetratricopeptide repeat protein [Beijerinckiaceae bacterium]
MRVIFFGLMVGTAVLWGAGAGAQQPRNAPPQSRNAPEPERKLPDPRHQSRTDQLFERLSAARDEAEASSLADQIERIWRRSGSDTIDLLMERAREAAVAKDGVLALDILDSVLALKPDWAEAYSRRANVLFQQQDFDGAMRDLRQTLQLEPRHFQALAGIGLIFQQGGNKKQALAAFREALKINPHIKGIKQTADKLSVENDGQNI